MKGIGRGLPYITNLETRWRNCGHLPLRAAGACVHIRVCVFQHMKQELCNSTASFRLVPCKILDLMYEGRGPGSSVGIATDYGLDGAGSNPGGDEIFRTHPDGPWGPPSLL